MDASIRGLEKYTIKSQERLIAATSIVNLKTKLEIKNEKENNYMYTPNEKLEKRHMK